jgi:hypothetical protein
MAKMLTPALFEKLKEAKTSKVLMITNYGVTIYITLKRVIRCQTPSRPVW